MVGVNRKKIVLRLSSILTSYVLPLFNMDSQTKSDETD